MPLMGDASGPKERHNTTAVPVCDDSQGLNALRAVALR